MVQFLPERMCVCVSLWVCICVCAQRCLSANVHTLMLVTPMLMIYILKSQFEQFPATLMVENFL